MSKFKEIGVTSSVVLVSSAIYGLQFNWCFMTNHLSAGGMNGIAQILCEFMPGAPLGLTIILLNLPLFLLGWKFLGKRFLLLSLTGMVTSSLFVDLFSMLYSFPKMEPLLACLYGGVLGGASLGMMFRRGVNTGGTDIAACLIKLKWRFLPIGQLLMVLNLLVVVTYSLVFKELDLALYSLVAIYVNSVVIDRVVYGSDGAKMALIISDKHERMVDILLRLNKGITVLHGEGAYTGRAKEVIFCVFKRENLAQVKLVVKRTDPDAFLVVSEAHEVLGVGFNHYRDDVI